MTFFMDIGDNMTLTIESPNGVGNWSNRLLTPLQMQPAQLQCLRTWEKRVGNEEKFVSAVVFNSTAIWFWGLDEKSATFSKNFLAFSSFLSMLLR